MKLCISKINKKNPGLTVLIFLTIAFVVLIVNSPSTNIKGFRITLLVALALQSIYLLYFNVLKNYTASKALEGKANFKIINSVNLLFILTTFCYRVDEIFNFEPIVAYIAKGKDFVMLRNSLINNSYYEN